MPPKLENVRDCFFLVLRIPSYLLISLIAAFLMLSFSVLILNAPLIFDPITPTYGILDKMLLVLKLLGGLVTNNSMLAATVLIITSLLAGINVALLAFKIKSIKSFNYKEGSLGTGGTFLSILTAGCSSCGIGILSLIGVAGGLTFLPFGGLELGFVGIAVLLFSIYLTSKGIMNCKSCQIVVGKNET